MKEVMRCGLRSLYAEKTENYINPLANRGGMPRSLFFPLDRIQPSEILSQYSEWIFFTLILIFFISVSGITLRKHFDKPYVKPLIISAGLMLTVGVFRFKDSLADIFEGWGILGTVMLVIMAATIPYGLCRGFGMHGGKAFYLTYIMLYIISWARFPYLYHSLADHNMGLINLGLLLLFFVAIFKVVRLPKLSSFKPGTLSGSGDVMPELGEELSLEDKERRLLNTQAKGMTRVELRNVKDIAYELKEIQRIIEAHRNTLPREERDRISHILREIAREEDLFYRNIQGLKKLFQRIDSADSKHLRGLKERMKRGEGKEKEIIKGELGEEGEKLKIEESIMALERRLGQHLTSFHTSLMGAVEHISVSPYPYDAKPYLEKARLIIEDIMKELKETKALEEDLIKLTRIEKRLLKKEEKSVEP